jgi:murein DD-endopeptidase MepM/ murein hydrolase activator NlpD
MTPAQPTSTHKEARPMKAFLIFLAGALLGSAALWFFVVGRMDRADTARNAPPVVPASLPVTRPSQPLKLGPPRSRPAIRHDLPPPPATPAKMTPVSQPMPPTPDGASAQAAAPAAPMDAAHGAILPPESTPVAPTAAPSQQLLPPPPAIASATPKRDLDLLMPVQGVRPAQLLDTYDDARGQGRVHDAIDIMAPQGTPVVAVEDGTIQKLFDSAQGGHTIYQFDAFGELAYYYAHLDRYAAGLTEGMAVKRGDLLGYVGYTGNASPTAPHLHFAIFQLGPEKRWWKGTPINPYHYLGGR